MSSVYGEREKSHDTYDENIGQYKNINYRSSFAACYLCNKQEVK